MVSCGVRLSEVGSSEFRKPQVACSIQVAGSIVFKHFQWIPLIFSLTSLCLVADSCGFVLRFLYSHRFIESIDRLSVGAWQPVTVEIDRHLDRAMAHLLFHIGW